MTEYDEIPWPKDFIAPFGEATAPDSDWVFNACMDPMPSWGRYALSYRTGAELLFKYVELSGERHNDLVVYPLVFCWRHYIELTLKQLVRSMRLLSNCSGNADLDDHRLMSLWNELQPHLPALGAPPGDIKTVGRTIQYLSRFDPGSFAFRYPTNRDGSSTQGAIPPRINLRRLDMVMRGIANWLEAGISESSMRLEYEAEMRAEYEAEMRAEYSDD